MNRTARGLVVLAAVAVVGCSAGDDPDGSRDGDKSVAGARAIGRGGGGATVDPKDFANAGGKSDPPPIAFVPDAGAVHDAGNPDAALSTGNACGVGTATAELTPVNMFVMFDRSKSMLDDDKWPNATAALGAFFANPGADGLSVALRFFPHDQPATGCTENGCDAVACSQPLVPIGMLTADPAPTDPQEDALVTAIASSAPDTSNGGGGTPIYAALDGALQWATSYQAMHTDQNTVVIFVTDGEPNGCDEDFANISKLASDALSGSGVTTYAIGLEGSSMDQMDQLAVAGGTKNGIFIGNSANAQEELLTALNAIRGETLACDFPMPDPIDASMAIDPTKVNVTFTPQNGMAATLGHVDDETGCGTSKAWHYDMPSDPSRIVLCPAACELVRSTPQAKLEILLGCETLCGGLDVDCGGGPPPPEVPPPIID
jgi:hypothetical protein